MTNDRETTLRSLSVNDDNRSRSSCRVAVLSLHTSPLDQPGEGDSGGLNVYVRKIAEEMALRRVSSDIFTRRVSPGEPAVREIVPGVRLICVDAGPARPVHKDRLPRLVGRFTQGVLAHAARDPFDVVHAHYWLSGVAGMKVAQQLDIPLVTSFHTLARVKDLANEGEPEPLFRKRGEGRVVKASDRLVAPTPAERSQLIELYGADPSRIVVAPPGVDLAVFHPRGRELARARFGFGDRPTVVFVGRLQPLKGAHVAVRALGRLKRMVPDAQLVIAGGDSPRGIRGELRRLRLIARRMGVVRRVSFLEPLPHHDLADLYRAADAVVIPSASESFGLVALEAAACGAPVVASAVGGLRMLVQDGHTGYLVDRREPARFAAALSRVLTDRAARERLGANGAELAARYPWSRTAEALLETYASIMACPDVREALSGTG